MQSAPIVAAASKPWRGVVMAMLVGMAFAANTSLAAVAYTGGVTPVTMLIARTATALTVLYLILRVKDVPRQLPAPQRGMAMVVGCFFTGYSFAVLVAIKYLPVGLVVATFYTFPLMIAVVEWRSGRQAFSARTAMALVTAFIGIVLALNVFGTVPNLFGITLCLIGAVCVTTVMTLSARARGDGDSRPVTLHMLGVALAVFLSVAVVTGDVALPSTTYAWFGFIAGPVFYTFAIVTLFIVFADIGPVKASMIMNVEPVTSVVLGYLLLDQLLSTTQLIGIGLVVASVLVVESAKQESAAASS